MKNTTVTNITNYIDLIGLDYFNLFHYIYTNYNITLDRREIGIFKQVLYWVIVKMLGLNGLNQKIEKNIIGYILRDTIIRSGISNNYIKNK